MSSIHSHHVGLAELQALVPAHPCVTGRIGRYTLRQALSLAEVEAACRLRYRVFNLELGKGLSSALTTGIDTDEFDSACDHLIVECEEAGVVGTYRMQSGTTARRHLGYYSAREFRFCSFEPVRAEVLELGRAAIDAEHRTSEVLMLLWRGIVQYARQHGLRYLVGCSSLTTQEPAEGWALFRQLRGFYAPARFWTEPMPGFALLSPGEPAADEPAPVVSCPRLLKTYLACGARIAAEPAWDEEFGTIDLLTLLDLDAMTPAARSRFLGGTGA